MVSNEPETAFYEIYVVASKSCGNSLVYFIVIFDCQGIVHYEFILGGKTANKDVYIYILRRFMDTFRRKRPEKMENQRLVSPSRQCSSTPVGFGYGFLSKERCDITGAPLHSPDLAPTDFYLFPRQKSALRGRSFCDATDVIKNATDELNRLSSNGFQEWFQHIYSRCQKCIVSQGDYFEANVA